MIVVMLTRRHDEAVAHARLAGLAMRDVLVPGSDNQVLRGLRLTDADLIVEFPSFDHHPHRDDIRAELFVVLARSRANPPWERLGR